MENEGLFLTLINTDQYSLKNRFEAV